MFAHLSFAPVSDAWKNSNLCIDSLPGDGPLTLVGGPFWMTILICALIITVLALFDRLIFSIETSSIILFRNHLLTEYLDNYNRIIALNISALLSIPIFGLLLYTLKISPHGYLYILIVLGGLVLLKYISILLIQWSTGVKKINGLFAISQAFFYLTTLLSLPVFIVNRFIGLSPVVYSIYLISIIAFLYGASIVKSRFLILNTRFSHFFCFLYLCALEILPVALAIKLIIA